MSLRWIAFVLILIVLFPAALLGSARAQPVQINVGQTSVTMNMRLIFQENLTSLPTININLSQSNSSMFLNPLSDAVKKLVPTAAASSLQLTARSTNSSGMWRLEEDYSMIITGASTNLGSSIRSRLDFVAMNVSQSLIVSNDELNAVGSAYLLAPLRAQDPKTTAYYIDGHQTLSSVIPAQTTSTFWLLDFTWVPRISSWSESQDLLRQTTTWSYDPGSPRYNLTLGTKSPEGPLIGIRMATYYPTFSISVPASAWLNGNTVAFDVPTSFDVFAPILAGVSLVALIAALIWDSRLARGLKIRKKK